MKIADEARPRASSRTKPLKRTMFANTSDNSPQKIVTEQVCQELRSFLALAAYGKKDCRVRGDFKPPSSPVQLLWS